MKKARIAGLFHLNDVNENKQTYPHDIDKVPIPAGSFEAKMIVGGEVFLADGTQPLHA